MAVFFQTNHPQRLLAALEELIQHGSIRDWYTPTPGEFTLTAARWIRLAYLQPCIVGQELRFYVRTYQGRDLSRQVYAQYQGALMQTFMQHLHQHFTSMTATPNFTPIEHAS